MRAASGPVGRTAAVAVLLILTFLAGSLPVGRPLVGQAAASAVGLTPPAGGAEGAQPLRGVVLAWEDGRLVRVAGAHVGTGDAALVTDATGRFLIPADQRPDEISVVVPGYWVERRQPLGDFVVVLLRPLEVQALYIPYDALSHQTTLDWALGLARRGVINALVIDVKQEQGAMLSIVANDTARQIGAVVDPPTDVEGFLDELQDLGVYRIARVVTFLDGWFAFNFPAEAILDYQGRVFEDLIGLAWSNPFSEAARRYNAEIGANAARYFDEVQYDYVRLPGDSGVAIRSQVTAEQRSSIIKQFAMEASQAVHAAGAAIAFDTFGQTTVIFHDDGIGQVLEEMAAYLDYYSPMVYPSTWSTGWFGLAYPPSDPYLVVNASVSLAVDRLAVFGRIVVRPWLQDFHDYQDRKMFYGYDQVLAQIRASDDAGGVGFMLWDPSLAYTLAVFDTINAPEIRFATETTETADPETDGAETAEEAPGSAAEAAAVE